MASKETRFKSKISIQRGYCKVSMRRDRLSKHTHQQHPGLNVVSQIFYPRKDHMIEKMKEKPTLLQKRKKTDGPDETQSGSTAATSEVKV